MSVKFELTDEQIKTKLGNLGKIDYAKYEDHSFDTMFGFNKCLRVINGKSLELPLTKKTFKNGMYKNTFKRQFEVLWIMFDAIGKKYTPNFNMEPIIYNVVSYLYGTDIFVIESQFEHDRIYHLTLTPNDHPEQNLLWYKNKNIAAGGEFISDVLYNQLKYTTNNSIIKEQIFKKTHKYKTNIIVLKKNITDKLSELKIIYNKKIITNKDSELAKQTHITSVAETKWNMIKLESKLLESKVDLYDNLIFEQVSLEKIASVQNYELAFLNILKKYTSTTLTDSDLIFDDKINASDDELKHVYAWYYQPSQQLYLKKIIVKCVLVSLYLYEKSQIEIFSDFDFKIHRFGEVIHHSFLSNDELISHICSVIQDYFHEYHKISNITKKLSSIYQSIELYIIKKYMSNYHEDSPILKFHKSHLFYKKKIQFLKLYKDKLEYFQQCDEIFKCEKRHHIELSEYILSKISQNQTKKNKEKRQRKKEAKQNKSI